MGQPGPLFCILIARHLQTKTVHINIDWTFLHSSVVFISGFLGSRHSSVVALSLGTQPSRLRIWLLEKSNREEKSFFREPAVLKLFSVFEKRQTRITNCNFTMPNFSETSTPNTGIQPMSLTWLEDARTKGRVAHIRAPNYAIRITLDPWPG